MANVRQVSILQVHSFSVTGNISEYVKNMIQLR